LSPFSWDALQFHWRPAPSPVSLRQAPAQFDALINIDVCRVQNRVDFGGLNDDSTERTVLAPSTRLEDPMKAAGLDLSTIMNRILDTAADNFRIAKILVQLGLDPNNITYDAIFNRLLEIVLANITLANMFALVGSAFFVATLLTQTMVPLRVANMIGCAFFVGFGALAHDVKTFFLYLLMLPINAVRLRQMLNLVRKARTATQGDTSMEWLKPFMTERKYRKGDVLFKKDDAANEMLLTVTGKFLVKEIGVELPPGRLMGELGFLTPDNRRTATIECIEDGHVLTITYEKLLEIYFQNPQFGYYFLVLTSQRLLENIARLEGIVAQNKAAQLTATATDPK
jgi:CRP-like cAMP-binding protein